METSDFKNAKTPEEKGAYFRAYVSSATGLRARADRNQNINAGSKELRKYLVDVKRFMTANEFKQKYGGLA